MKRIEYMTGTQQSVSLQQAYAERDSALSQVEPSELRMAKLRQHCLRVLMVVGPMTGEELTDACTEAYLIAPNNGRAMGAVIKSLSRSGHIARVGYSHRLKGHGTAGAIVWGLT